MSVRQAQSPGAKGASGLSEVFDARGGAVVEVRLGSLRATEGATVTVGTK